MSAAHLPLRWPLLQPSVALRSRLHGFEQCVVSSILSAPIAKVDLRYAPSSAVASRPFRPYHCCAPTIIRRRANETADVEASGPARRGGRRDLVYRHPNDPEGGRA